MLHQTIERFSALASRIPKSGWLFIHIGTVISTFLTVGLFLFFWIQGWGSAIDAFIIAVESKYPQIAELREKNRTYGILDKIPNPIFRTLYALDGPFILIYLKYKIRKILIEEGVLEKDEPLLTPDDI